MYAIGGNVEAARRAGINVRWVKMSCFIMTGLVACLAGMALASQLNSVSPQTGGNDTLLRAVGAAAIGGVCLFGGRGKLIYPVVGGLVVATIDNGLGLMGTVAGIDFTQSGPKFIVQGLVLLLAASVDAISRQRAGGDVDGPPVRWGVPRHRQDRHPAVEGVREAAGDAQVDRRREPRRRDGPQRTPRSTACRGRIEGYDALLADADVDAVYICLPNGMHHDWTMRALEAGKHVLCEKPYTRRADEAVEAYGRAEAYGLVLSEAFMWRHNPQTRAPAEALAEIGRLESMHATFGFRLEDQTNHRLDARRRRLADGRRLLLHQRRAA